MASELGDRQDEEQKVSNHSSSNNEYAAHGANIMLMSSYPNLYSKEEYDGVPTQPLQQSAKQKIPSPRVLRSSSNANVLWTESSQSMRQGYLNSAIATNCLQSGTSGGVKNNHHVRSNNTIRG